MRSKRTVNLNPEQCTSFLAAIRTDERIKGLTHSFYRYPARFSPHFPAAAIRCFTKPGDVVLDPYMGGGTTVVEALAAGRRTVGNDLNELAVFVAQVKTRHLNCVEVDALRSWALSAPQAINYRHPVPSGIIPSDNRVVRNLGLYRSRYVKKGIALALSTIDDLPTEGCRNFARCVILRVGQIALDGRRTHTTLQEFRAKLRSHVEDMLKATIDLAQISANYPSKTIKCDLYKGNAENLAKQPVFSVQGEKADLVITSPPYPGVHVLYHRWQVDGRKETPAPYWITDCHDGEGAAYYNFGDRHQKGLRRYFETAEVAFRAVRSVMKDDAHLVQLIAFSDPQVQLPQYLDVLQRAGLEEVFFDHRYGETSDERIWREVPNRKWHANSKGLTRSAREVVLIHRAA